MNILQFLDSDALTPGSFKGESWQPWRAVHAGIFGLPMDDDTRATFDRLSGGREPPQERVRQAFIIAGRRAAKSHNAAAIGVYLGTVGAEVDGLLDRLSHGERGVIAIVAVDRAQARVALNYVRGLLESSPVLEKMILKQDAEAIHLTNRVSIEVGTNSHRSVRGRTLLAAVLDECAFFRDDSSASPDVEVYRALLPGLATTGGLLIGISSPYSRKGLLFQQWRKHYGKNSDTLVIQAATSDLNPTLDPRVIADAMEDDPEAAKAEWLGQFRSDVETFIQREAIEACTIPDRVELPPISDVAYSAFVDPSGGSGKDAFTMAICHKENDVVVIDAVRARRPPFSPETVIEEFASLLKSYNVRRVTGDRFGGEFPREQFRKHGIEYQTADKPKSDLYRDLLPLVNSGRVELLDNKQLQSELIGLERRTARGGRDSIDHAPGQHDDLANVVAGAAGLAKRVHKPPVLIVGH